MTDVSKALEWDVGEYSHNAKLEEVELGGTGVTYEPGDVVKFNGINSAGQMIAVKITGTDTPRGVVAKGQGGTSGEIKAIVCDGDVVAKVGGVIAAGEGLSTAGGKLVKDSAGSSSAGTFGFARGTTTADGDTVLICFKT